MADGASAASAEHGPSAEAYPPWYTRWKPTSLAERKDAEKKLLALTKAQWHTQDTAVGQGQQAYMHSIQGGPQNAPPLVCLPGYGAGAAFYFRNLAVLCEHFRVYAVDPLGTGMSGRPDFTAKSRQQAEEFFITALEAWRKKMGLERVVLMGHSLGGYLAATYALQHPEHVQHLVLVGPAGMLKVPGYTLPPAMSNPWSWKGQLYRFSTKCWAWGGTPGIVIRGLGPLGKAWIGGYTRARFKEGMPLSQQELEAFGQYIYHISAAKGSGEHALKYILKPFGESLKPMEDELQHLKVPVTFIFGELDWTNPKGVAKVCEQIKKKRGQLSSADLMFASLPKAGHYPFLDQPELFMQALLEQTEPYRATNHADTTVLSKHTGDVDLVAASGDNAAQQCSAEDVILASLEG